MPRYTKGTVIDLTPRILQPSLPPRPAPPHKGRWHPLRRALQILCGLLLVALPLTNGLRLDVRQNVFYFAWHRMAAHDLLLLFWIAMLGVWALVAVSFLYGRLWCGWVCPQTLASDFADSLKARLDKALRARRGRTQFWLARGVWALLLTALAIGTGLLLACYWLDPHAVARAAWHPLSDVPAALTAYGLAAVIAADMLWVRRKFCAHACPYGALLGLLADKNTLAMRYLDERDDDCIRCGKCVTVCPMGIDIKKGVGQIECIGCGECADACNDVLGRRGVPGLIEYRYGLSPDRKTRSLSRLQRWGLWDGTRAAIVATLFVFLAVVVWLMFGRTPLAASVIASGAIVRNVRTVCNTYTLTLQNGTPDAQTYALTAQGLPGAALTPAVLTLAPRDTVTLPVTVAVPVRNVQSARRVPIRLQAANRQSRAVVPTFFYAPAP